MKIKVHLAGLVCLLGVVAQAQVLPGGNGAKFTVVAEIGAKVELLEFSPTISFTSPVPSDGMVPKTVGDVYSAQMASWSSRPAVGVAYLKINAGKSLTFDFQSGSPLKVNGTGDALPTSFYCRMIGAFTVDSVPVTSGSLSPPIVAPETGTAHFVCDASSGQTLETWYYGKVRRSGLDDWAGTYSQDPANKAKVVVTVH